MDPEEITRLLKAQPFAPFAVVTNDGTRLPVMHPELCKLTEDPSGLTVYVYVPGRSESSPPYRAVVVATVNITQLDPLAREETLQGRGAVSDRAADG